MGEDCDAGKNAPCTDPQRPYAGPRALRVDWHGALSEVTFWESQKANLSYMQSRNLESRI